MLSKFFISTYKIMFFVISIGVLLFHKFLEMFYGAWTDGSSCEIFYQPYDLKVIN